MKCSRVGKNVNEIQLSSISTSKSWIRLMFSSFLRFKLKSLGKWSRKLPFFTWHRKFGSSHRRWTAKLVFFWSPINHQILFTKSLENAHERVVFITAADLNRGTLQKMISLQGFRNTCWWLLLQLNVWNIKDKPFTTRAENVFISSAVQIFVW